MLLFEQLDLLFDRVSKLGRQERKPPASPGGTDSELEALCRDLLHAAGAPPMRSSVRVEWNSRMRTAAGRADFHRNLISLNPRLREHGHAEIDRTLRHELAHLLAHARAGRRRINAHGAEWRQACCDLGIAGEARCHTLPFPTQRRRRRFLYRCPKCEQDFPRVRRIRRAVACLACCRKHSGGRFDRRFRLEFVRNGDTPVAGNK